MRVEGGGGEWPEPFTLNPFPHMGERDQHPLTLTPFPHVCGRDQHPLTLTLCPTRVSVASTQVRLICQEQVK